MDAGGLAHMSHSNLPTPSSGLASRRGGQTPKPLSFDAWKSPTDNDNTIPTPRTARGHLLAGLRTAPKTASAATFANNPASPTSTVPPYQRGGDGNSVHTGLYDNSGLYNGPKTSIPRFSAGQQQGHNPMAGLSQQHYTADQILAPPQLNMEDPSQDQMDPNMHAQLLLANAYLSEQQQRLQQQLMNLQVAAQQFQGLNLNAQYQAMPQTMPQAYPNMYQHQQHVKNMQPIMTPTAQPNIYSVYDPVTGQQTLYVDQSQQQLQQQFINQAQLANNYAALQQQQQQQQQAIGTPRVQVSPPPPENQKPSFRNNSPPRRHGSPIENPAPLPPPSANAFRRGHKKSASLINKNGLGIGTEDALKSAGPKTASFPLTPLTATGSYGPGQARAGEHPVRQPRNPPSMDELKAKPTAKHEGGKNFVTRTRRSAINNLVRAGLERRKEARSSGSASPVSQLEEPIETPTTDNDSDSGRSGSGSLVDGDDADCSLPSSRTSTGSWGAIGSDRPSSRNKLVRNRVDSLASSDSESAAESGSFASVFKNASRTPKPELADGQRKAPMMVLGSAEKRRVLG